MKTLKEQIAQLDNPPPPDIDPEAHEPFDQSSESDSLRETDEINLHGREHYQVVEKSKLRKPDQPVLGKQYAGSAVSRNDLDPVNGDENDPLAPAYEESDSDPFAQRGTPSDSEDTADDDASKNEMAQADGEAPVEEDEEIDSDEAFGEDDSERFKNFKFSASTGRPIMEGSGSSMQRNQSVNGMEDLEASEASDLAQSSADGFEDDSDLEVDENDLDDSDEDNQDGEDDSRSDSPGSPSPASITSPYHSDRAALKALLLNDTATVASNLSAAANSDAEKGKAVRQQSHTLDRILDARIKLQKGLGATNGLPTASEIEEGQFATAIRKAEEAAVALWSTIETIRYAFLENGQSQSSSPSSSESRKRKRPSSVTAETPVVDLWTRTQSLESVTLPHHRAILNKWSAKTRASSGAATSTAPRSQLLDRSKAPDNNISRVLDTYLTTHGEKLFETATTTVIGEPNPATSPLILPQTLSYDDTPFYQTLLRDLVSSRSSHNDTTLLPHQSTSLSTKLHPSGSSTSRTGKKLVDTRASKGRKVRYTVHEKLQNFMAAEYHDDNNDDDDGSLGAGGTWGLAARREFFGSLLGGQMALAEEEDEEEDAGKEEQIGEDAKNAQGEGALRLF